MTLRFVAMTATAAPEKVRATLSRRFCVIDQLTDVIKVQTDCASRARDYAKYYNWKEPDGSFVIDPAWVR